MSWKKVKKGLKRTFNQAVGRPADAPITLKSTINLVESAVVTTVNVASLGLYKKSDIKDNLDTIQNFINDTGMWVRDALANGLEWIFNQLGYEDETVYTVFKNTSKLMSIGNSFQSEFDAKLIDVILNEKDIPTMYIGYMTNGRAGVIDQYFVDASVDYVYGLPSITYTNRLGIEDASKTSILDSLAQKGVTNIQGISVDLKESIGTVEWILAIASKVPELQYSGYGLYNGVKYRYSSHTGSGPYEVTFKSDTGGLLNTTIPKPEQGRPFYYLNATGVRGGENIQIHELKLLGEVALPVTNDDVPFLDIDLDEVPDTNTLLAAPILLIRDDKHTLTPSSAVYQSVEKVLDSIDLELKQLADSINNNDQIQHVTDVFATHLVSIYSNDKVSKKYLYYFFNALHSIKGNVTKEKFMQGGMFKGLAQTLLAVKEDGGYNYALAIDWSYLDYSEGSIGPIGEIRLDMVELPTVRNVEESDPATGEDIIVDTGYDPSYIVFHHQVTGTKIRRLTVSGITVTNSLIGESFGLVSNKIVNPATIKEEEKGNLYVPYLHAIGCRFEYAEVEELFYRSLAVVILAETKQVIDWYKTENFNNLIDAASFIVSVIVTGGVGAFAVKKLIDAAVDKILDNSPGLSKDEKMALRAIQVVATIYLVSKPGSLSAFTVDNAVMYSTAVSNLVRYYSNYEIESLQEKFNNEVSRYNSAMDKLKEIEDGLATDESINPLLLLQSANARIETPVAFYNRVYTTNTADMCYDYISRYHDTALTLPRMLHFDGDTLN